MVFGQLPVLAAGRVMDLRVSMTLLWGTYEESPVGSALATFMSTYIIQTRVLWKGKPEGHFIKLSDW